MNFNKLPQTYKPLTELNICSNKLFNGAKLIGINDFAPLLIGDGVVPEIWMYGQDNQKGWIEIIRKNKSLHPAIQLVKDMTNREIIIGIQNDIILKGRMLEEKKCLISSLDLRPIGFDIHGNTNELYIANSSFSGNTFDGSGFLVGMEIA